MFKFNRNDDDFVYFGEQRVEIPKLTVGKWMVLFENIETLPQLIVNVLSTRGTDHFTASLIVGISLALEETVMLVAGLTGLDEAFIKDTADHNDLIDFIMKTVKKNDLSEAAKKFQAVLAKANKAAAAAGVVN
ncbi:hypothetical protein [Paenibacillus sp. OAE614]|uniref:hypothetical protein n=1 Tax=Paenibacillus sp. OAE614 TaxID=2663804 RepID=UPI00178BF188